MADAAIWLASTAALLAALCGDRAAVALLASLVFASVMEWSAVPFHPLLWAGLDVAVCAALIRPTMPWRNVLIVLLFVPAWGAYFMPEPWRYLVPAGVVIAQFVLTIPAIDLGQFRARHHSTRGQWRDFDLREQA